MAEPTPVNGQITDSVTQSTGGEPAAAEPAGKFVWRDLMTSDLERARKYYAELLGWTYEETEVEGYGKYPMIRAAGESWGGLVQLDPAQGVHSHWLSYVSVEDVDAAAAKAAELGGTVAFAPADIPGVGRFAVISDPAGASIAPYRSLNPATSGPQNVAGAGAFCWHELLANHPEVEGRFFSQIFGWTLKEQEIDGNNYHLFHRPGMEAAEAGMLAKPPGSGGPSSWLPYVAVEDVDATAARARELGGKIWVEAADIQGIGRFAVTSDPMGAMIALFRAV